MTSHTSRKCPKGKGAKCTCGSKKKKTAGGAKRPHNKYFKEMLAARKSDKDSFVYNGKTYVKHKLKTGLITYKSK